jgi:hypothetical protein
MHKVFDEIGNNRTTIIHHIDHIISKASIRILVLAVKLHHKGRSNSSWCNIGLSTEGLHKYHLAKYTYVPSV